MISVHRITNHRHSPVGLQAGMYIYIYIYIYVCMYICMYVCMYNMYMVGVHYRYYPAELRIGMPQQYVCSTLIGIPIYP